MSEHDRHGGQAPELAKQGGLALHHRQRRRRADVAQTEHRSPVADNGDQSGPPGIAISKRMSSAIARQTSATPGVYASESDSRSTSGMVLDT